MKNILILWAGLSVLSFAAESVVLEQKSSKAATEMATAATQFVASLTPEQSEKAMFAFTADERENWKFTPQPRKGIAIEALTPEQIVLSKKMLASLLSERALIKAGTIMQLEAYLAELEKDPVKRNSKAYFTSIFGKPSATETWGWRFEGHHLAMNITLVKGSQIVVAPAFMGANPALVRGGALDGTQPLAKEETIARSLAKSLQGHEKKVIYTEKAPNDVLTGEKRVAEQLEAVGISLDQFSDEEKKLLDELIGEYANRLRNEMADAEIKKIKDTNPKDIRFAWAGSLEVDKAYYYRVQTPEILIECCNTQNNANHIHTVWRNVKNDFARDSLSEHLKEGAH